MNKIFLTEERNRLNLKAKDVANPDYLTELLMKGMLFVKL